MDLKEKRLSSEYVFQGNILRVRVDTVLLPDGRTGSREVVEYAGAVAVVALDALGRVVLVRQYRYPVGEELLEIPAGKLEAGEDPLACARRELLEETGFAARDWRLVCSYYSTPGFTSERMHVFLATELEPKEASADADEFIEVDLVPLEKALAMIGEGTIRDGKSLVGLLTVVRELGSKEPSGTGANGPERSSFRPTSP
ncbi:MAG: NUDIX hydrolase [Bacillota bacterium]